jgi:hypothetical protein
MSIFCENTDILNFNRIKYPGEKKCINYTIFFGIFVLTYNLGNFLRQLALPKALKEWSLWTLRAKLIRIGAKVVRHSRYMIFQMEEVAVPRTLFREILDRIQRLRFSTIPARPG